MVTKPSGLIQILYNQFLWGFVGICCGLVAFIFPTEGRRKDPDEFWSTSRVERSKSDDEEALASQQETQMIFFIQQVA